MEVVMDEPLAHKMWAKQQAYLLLECQVDDQIIKILGKDEGKPDEWGFTDITYDDYDGSFELKGCTQEFNLTQEQKLAFRALGFSQCWFCKKGPGEYDPGKHIWFPKLPL